MHKPNSYLNLAAALATALVFSLGASGLAQACCIYNNTTHPLQVEQGFHGWDFVVPPSNKECRPGESIEANFYLLDAERAHQISTSKKQNVDEHGWLSVYKKEGDKWRVVNKHKDGSIKSTTHLSDY